MDLDINFGEMIELGGPTELTTQTIEEDKNKPPVVDDDKGGVIEDTDFTFIDTNDVKTIEEVKKDEDSIEDKEDKSKAPPQQETTPQETKESSNVPEFLLLFKSLSEEGALASFNEEAFNKDIEEFGTATAIFNATKNHIDEATNARLSELDEDAREYSTLKDLGISSEEAGKLVSGKIKFDSIKDEDLESEDNEALRKEILIQNFKNTTKLNDARIEKQVDRIIAAGEDVDEAKEALNDIKEFNKAQIQAAKDAKIQEEKQKELDKVNAVKAYKEYISNSDEIIKDIKINKSTKDKLEKNIMSGYMWQLRQQDPVKFDTTITYALMNNLLEGKFDKVEKAGTSKAFKELQNKLSTTNSKTSIKPNTEIIDDDASADIDNLMNGLTSIVNKRKTF